MGPASQVKPEKRKRKKVARANGPESKLTAHQGSSHASGQLGLRLAGRLGLAVWAQGGRLRFAARQAGSGTQLSGLARAVARGLG